MSRESRRDAAIVAVALAEFSYQYEPTHPDVADRAWLLAADRLVEYDLEPTDAVALLELNQHSGDQGDPVG